MGLGTKAIVLHYLFMHHFFFFFLLWKKVFYNHIAVFAKLIYNEDQNQVIYSTGHRSLSCWSKNDCGIRNYLLDLRDEICWVIAYNKHC